MKIGLDFGTTHTTAAFYDEGKLTFIPLDPQNHDPHLLRSMIYVTKQHEHLLGLQRLIGISMIIPGGPLNTNGNMSAP